MDWFVELLSQHWGWFELIPYLICGVTAAICFWLRQREERQSGFSGGVQMPKWVFYGLYMPTVFTFLFVRTIPLFILTLLQVVVVVFAGYSELSRTEAPESTLRLFKYTNSLIAVSFSILMALILRREFYH